MLVPAFSILKKMVHLGDVPSCLGRVGCTHVSQRGDGGCASPFGVCPVDRRKGAKEANSPLAHLLAAPLSPAQLSFSLKAYSPKCVEGVFSEVRPVLGSKYPRPRYRFSRLAGPPTVPEDAGRAPRAPAPALGGPQLPYLPGPSEGRPRGEGNATSEALEEVDRQVWGTFASGYESGP